MNTLPKIRNKPISIREMFDWGMISYKTFKVVENMSFEDAISYCDNLGLYQTWSHSKQHLIDHVQEHNLHNQYTDRMEFIKRIMIITDGKINPAVAQEVWKHFNLGD